MGADNMDDYRTAAEEDDARRVEAGEPPFEAGPARRWLRKRAKLSLSLHCKGKTLVGVAVPTGWKSSPGCTCQCRIPELQP